uniref:Uncharacterized protein n=1 Tax=Moniliophthora roreri TaxID=221103 RepID=A0A0W0G9T2_MONRR
MPPTVPSFVLGQILAGQSHYSLVQESHSHPSSSVLTIQSWTPSNTALDPTVSHAPSMPHSCIPSKQTKKQKKAVGPAPTVPGCIILNIPSTMENNWKLAIKQYNEGNPVNRLTTLLKDWPLL